MRQQIRVNPNGLLSTFYLLLTSKLRIRWLILLKQCNLNTTPTQAYKQKTHSPRYEHISNLIFLLSILKCGPLENCIASFCVNYVYRNCIISICCVCLALFFFLDIFRFCCCERRICSNLLLIHV